MFEAFKEKLAWNRTLKLTRRREIRPWNSDPGKRRTILVLPSSGADARLVWQFVLDIGLEPQNTLPIVPAGDIAYAPVDFLGRAASFNHTNITRLGLPNKELREQIDAFAPEVAISLAQQPNLPAIFMVGTSQAAFRIGFGSSENLEPYFDLMIDSTNMEKGLETLRNALSIISPPILDTSSIRSDSTRAVW